MKLSLGFGPYDLQKISSCSVNVKYEEGKINIIFGDFKFFKSYEYDIRRVEKYILESGKYINLENSRCRERLFSYILSLSYNYLDEIYPKEDHELAGYRYRPKINSIKNLVSLSNNKNYKVMDIRKYIDGFSLEQIFDEMKRPVPEVYVVIGNNSRRVSKLIEGIRYLRLEF